MVLSSEDEDDEELPRDGLNFGSLSDHTVTGKGQSDSQLQPSTRNLLSQLFGDEKSETDDDTGIILDQAQIDILSKSWRVAHPERLGAFKDEYRQLFPIHESSKELLQVPGLDDILETMLTQKYGPKAVKSWGKSKHLFSQPFRNIEGLAFQGQMAARFGIITVLYMQQTLASLMAKLQENPIDQDYFTGAVKDLFSMSTKTLDQFGRTGAFHHMVRRKAACADSGLSGLDVQSKVLCLPLSGDGVFGKGLQDQLKQRKEQKDQLSELMPELSFKRPSQAPVKRKLPPATVTSSSSYGNRYSSNNFSQPKYARRSDSAPNRGHGRSYSQARNSDFRQKSTGGGKTDGGSGSFRIPKKD